MNKRAKSRKFLSLLLSLAMVLGICGTALADEVTGLEDESVTVTVDGEDVELANADGESVAPVIIDGSTYLPIRAVAEALGLDVEWIGGATREVQLTTGGETAPADTAAVAMATVELPAGTLLGYEDDGVYAFKGIPYATAERFQSPVAVEAYPNGFYAALAYGPVAPQDKTLPNELSSGDIILADFVNPTSATSDMIGNETCQYLNVWSSDLTAKKPVIVFFHGGGLNNGASNEQSVYTGEFIVESEEAVFVTVNHRLNVLGFLDMSEYGEEYASSAIAGIEDCVVALQWVHDIIAKFGGDPGNVTIVGQSGGGVKVSTLACMSDTVDLFDKVFVMSGRISNVPKSVGLETTHKLVDYLVSQGVAKDDILETLVNMPYEELYNTTKAAGVSNWSNTCYGNGTYETPLIDNEGNINPYAAQRTWIIGADYSEMSVNAFGLMGALNMDEYLPNITDEIATERLTAKYGDNTEQFIALYREAYPNKPLAEALYLNPSAGGNTTVNFSGQSRKETIEVLCPTLAAGGVTVYNYVAAYTLPVFGGVTTHHCADIGFWFNSIAKNDYLVQGDRANAYALASTMSGALAAFAATGDPSTAELEWKPWTADEHNTMVFDTESYLGTDFDTELYKLMFAE